jgi:hypothetical protein
MTENSKIDVDAEKVLEQLRLVIGQQAQELAVLKIVISEMQEKYNAAILSNLPKSGSNNN